MKKENNMDYMNIEDHDYSLEIMIALFKNLSLRDNKRCTIYTSLILMRTQLITLKTRYLFLKEIIRQNQKLYTFLQEVCRR